MRLHRPLFLLVRVVLGPTSQRLLLQLRLLIKTRIGTDIRCSVVTHVFG